MRTENTKKKTENKIVYSEYDSRKVTEALDYVLDLRDAYLWGTVFKWCKLGYVRSDEAYPVSEKNERNRTSSVWRVLGKLYWNAFVCIVGWFVTMILYARWSEAYIYDPGGLWFMAALFIVLWVCIYKESMKRIRIPVIQTRRKRDIEFLGKEGGRKKGAGYRLGKFVLRKSTWHALLCTVLLWYVIMYVFIPETGDFFKDVLSSAVVYAVVFIVYQGLLGRKRFEIHDLPDPLAVFWEDRADVKAHLWTTEEFGGLSGNRVLRKLEAEQFEENLVHTNVKYKGVRYHARNLLEYACELSMLRCLCLLSEEVRRFAERCGGDEGKIEFEVYYVEKEGLYKGYLSGSVMGEQDTVVPVETQSVHMDFVLPSPVGKKMLRELYRSGRLRLDVWDRSFEKTGKYLEENKGRMQYDLKKYGSRENSKAFQLTDRTDIFTGIEEEEN